MPTLKVRFWPGSLLTYNVPEKSMAITNPYLV